MRLRKISDPKEIMDIVYEDKGDIPPPTNVYTSKFIIDGKELLNQVPKSNGNIQKIRFASDRKFLSEHDLDLDSYEELNVL